MSPAALSTAMAMFRLMAAALWLLQLAQGQQVDKTGPEDTRNSGIRIKAEGKDRPQFVVLDANYRWLYNSSKQSCTSGGAETMEKCFLAGLSTDDYKGTYGVYMGYPTNRAITLRYASKGKSAPKPNYGQRVYLTDGNGYTMFRPLGGEIEFTVDISQIPAGMNAAVYFVSMDRLGHLNSVSPSGVMNTAGWTRGLGYCDAQCPKDPKFAQDKGFNSGHLASCCPEMDLFEANRFVTAMTAHPCKHSVETVCNSNEVEACRKECDTDGADVNPFREKGPGHALFELLDVSKPMKVRTIFQTDTGGEDGTLIEVLQIYSQEDGKSFNISLTDESNAKTKELFRSVNGFGEEFGGLKQMGESLRKGMVMAIALWADPGGNMNWLDSCSRNKSEFDCSLRPTFDSSVWEEAWKALPGSWRGPADYYPDFATSYQTRAVSFNYAGIPAAYRTQVKFTCEGCDIPGGVCDCSSVPYQFYVKDISVSSVEKTSPTAVAQAGGGGGSSHILQWILIAAGVLAAAAFSIACINRCSEDEVENMGSKRRKAQGAREAQSNDLKLMNCGGHDSDSSDTA